MIESIAVFSAAFLQSITGFGFAIVTAPILMFFYPAKFVVILMFLLSSVTNFMQMVILWRNAIMSIVLGLVCGSVIGQQLGVHVYNGITDGELKTIISILILISISFIQLFKIKLKLCFRNSFIVGFFSGVMAIITSMAGPPIIIYFLCSDIAAVSIRGTCVVFFMISNIIAMITFVLNGVDFTPVIDEVEMLIPAVILGIIIGQKAFTYMNDAVVKKLMYVTLYALCLYNIYEYVAG